MARESKAQKDTVGRVMHEFKHGELETARGDRKVRNPKQAIAIALREAGASKDQSRATNKASLKRTKAKERRGETAQAEKEGRQGASGRRSRQRSSGTASKRGSGSKRSTTKRAASTRRASTRRSSRSRK